MRRARRRRGRVPQPRDMRGRYAATPRQDPPRWFVIAFFVVLAIIVIAAL